MLPGKKSDPVRTAKDNRLFVNGVLWVLRSEAQWDEPRYGRYKSVHERLTRWAKKGVWERIFAELTSDRRNADLMLDATHGGAHQQAATGKGGAKRGRVRTRLWAFPRWTDDQDPSAH
jgi:transposase